MRWLLGLMMATVVTGCAGGGEEASSSDSAIVGGRASAAHPASGYLVRGEAPGAVACGATLIAPRVVVTAAHCVTDDAATFAFGTGDLGGATVRVASRHPHPDFHPTSTGLFDVDHALRKFDVAYLVLERPASVAPAALSSVAPTMGVGVDAIGYRAGKRVTAPASIIFGLSLGSDPIFELHPTGDSALCVADGDEGSAVVGADGALVGIYVGSVTQGFTDCSTGSQYLDGYESMFGYAEFLKSGIAANE